MLWLVAARSQHGLGRSFFLPRVEHSVTRWEDAVRAAREWILIGYVGYHARHEFLPVDPPKRPPLDFPPVWFAVTEWVWEYRPGHGWTRLDRYGLRQVGHPPLPEISRDGQLYFRGWSLTQEMYRQRVRTLLDHIRSGEIYQANFTLGSRWCLDGSPLGLFHRLLQRQPTAFSAFFQLPEDRYVLSFSPELFLAWKGDLLWTLPMKGTRPRGSTPDEDRVLKQELVESPKDRAENIMIVDLLRNDLGKLARPGTVQVPRMFQVETYPTVHQMVSRVEARLRPEARTPEALFQALFPGGSVTGAPKLRAVELLQELEPEERGVYCGAIGILFPWKEAVFNLAIRTLALQGGRAWYGVGGGIVLDSRPEAEWSEVENKTAFLRT